LRNNGATDEDDQADRPDVAILDTHMRSATEAERQRYDVVRMDVQMPEVDGPTASREIKPVPI
jgi:CheY-like chemotaxis protein